LFPPHTHSPFLQATWARTINEREMNVIIRRRRRRAVCENWWRP
jgi:hypothetical protein